ncbi:MAG: DUF2442 domain-containing protein [candidate division KSB1 bacterium]|nr:DUF2442 domain-containing protein [candidate division KSB1 bacterium]MDZ7341395.1 DUF2442 domain-containing protein [candidate division KSB1 bacterium]
MKHPVYKVKSFRKIAPYTLKVEFNDGTVREIYFYPILKGKLYGALRDSSFFDQVKIDPEVHTLIWPNGADFDPATLHDWDKNLHYMEQLVNSWEQQGAESVLAE